MTRAGAADSRACLHVLFLVAQFIEIRGEAIIAFDGKAHRRHVLEELAHLAGRHALAFVGRLSRPLSFYYPLAVV
jgi:hypothetical protein